MSNKIHAEFGKDLNTGQEILREDNINMPDEVKLQHYMEQMYESSVFYAEKMNVYKDFEDKDNDWDNTVMACSITMMKVDHHYAIKCKRMR